MQKEYDDMKSTIYRPNNPSDLARVAKALNRICQFIEDFSLFIKQCYHIVWSVEKYRK